MSTLSLREREKYEEIWTFPEYRGDHVTKHAREAIALMGAQAGDSIIDFGAGAGYASAHLLDSGFHVLAVDIAVNAMSPEIAPRVPRLIGNLWELPVDILGDWGFCCDLMEHIPTEHVRDVLLRIRRSTRRSTYFGIALHPDKCGALIGKPLHLTVRDADWWLSELAQCWSGHTVVEHHPGSTLTVVAF